MGGMLLDFDYREVRIAQVIIQNARKTFWVTNSSKLARSAPVRIAQMSEIDHYFTDKFASEAFRQVCEHHGVEISTVVAVSKVKLHQ